MVLPALGGAGDRVPAAGAGPQHREQQQDLGSGRSPRQGKGTCAVSFVLIRLFFGYISEDSKKTKKKLCFTFARFNHCRVGILQHQIGIFFLLINIHIKLCFAIARFIKASNYKTKFDMN